MREWKAWAIMCGKEIWGRGVRHHIYPSKKMALENYIENNNPPLRVERIKITLYERSRRDECCHSM